MSVALVIEDASQIGPDLRWALRVAALRGHETFVVVPHPQAVEVDLARPDEAAPNAREVALALRAALDASVGAERWCPASGASGDADERMAVALELVPREKSIDRALRRLEEREGRRLIFVTAGDRGREGDWKETSRRLLTQTSCEVIHVLPGRRVAEGKIVVGASRGAHARDAMRLAARLAGSVERRLTGLYVEPNIGPDSVAVGRKFLERRLVFALDEGAAEVERQVEVADRDEEGVLRAGEDERCEVLVLGTSHLGGLGVAPRGVAIRVHRATDEPTLVVVRAAVPLASRIRRWLDYQLERRVPQLGREERIDLVSRIQSNSRWNFDFVLLVALATLIASLGLLDESPAVIIGAMLVAPLMTPLLGVGLALSQGNPRLATMSLKAVGLGFLAAFVLALAVGLASPDFHQATIEMESRDWPQVLDLVVAFVSGLAAAYASGRPGLLAALPGVAIAAAVLPPIATSGLAVAIGDVDLALGSLLLFAVNVVAIILAAAASLWAVGLRRLRAPTVVTRWVGGVLIGLAVLMTLLLVLAPPRLAPSPALVRAVETELGEGVRLRHIRLRTEPEGPVVQIDVGGVELPKPALGDALRDIAREHLGDEVGVRLTFRYEALSR